MSKMKNILTIIILMFMVSFSIELSAEQLPEGWRLPTEYELKTPPINWREESPSKFAVIEADFDGNGEQDKAYLVKSTKYSGEGLLVRLSLKNKHKWVVLDKIKWGKEYPNVSLAMGIEVAKPQKMKTACGKGYWECTEKEVPEINLIKPGILYFKFASASSIFYWNQTQMKFNRTWISD